MVINRWWHVAVATTLVATTAMLLLAGASPIGYLAVAIFGIAWIVLSPRVEEGNTAARLLVAAVTASLLLGCIAAPDYAFVQCIAYPIAWVLARSVKEAIACSGLIAIAVGTGFVLGRPASPEWLGLAAVTAGLSFAFSLALGLWITSIVRVGEDRRTLLEELTATQQQLTAASREAGIFAERERLARELHDTISQDLAGIVMLAEQSQRETDAATRERQLALLGEAAREALRETRLLVAAGSPVPIDGGLAAALSRVTTRFGSETDIAVTLTVDTIGEFDRDDEVVILRCTQEALANVRKHSGAGVVAVTVDGRRLTVVDDGHGFDASTEHSGFGLGGMRDRLAHAGGTLSLTSDEHGTTLTVELSGAGESSASGPSRTSNVSRAPEVEA